MSNTAVVKHAPPPQPTAPPAHVSTGQKRMDHTQLALLDNAQVTLVKYGADGQIKQVRAQLQMSEERGHVYQLKCAVGDKKWELRPVLTALGYDRANQLLGVMQIPVSMCHGRPNGMPERDLRTGAITRVTWRKAGLGRNAAGNLQVYESVVTLDLQNYLAESAFSKWKSREWGDKTYPAKAWGRMLPGRQASTVEEFAAYIPVLDETLMCIKADPEAQSIMGEAIQRQKFAERICETIAWERVLKKFCAATRLGRDGVLTVTGWCESDEVLQRVVQQAKESSETALSEFVASVGMEHETETVEVDDPNMIDAAASGQASKDDGEAEPGSSEAPSDDTPPDGPPSPAAAEPPTEDQIRTQIRERLLGADPKKMVQALNECGYQSVTALKAALLKLSGGDLQDVIRAFRKFSV